ncbi:MAG: polysaccharide pyruvyl transferase family protein [Caldilineales bacterium]|nr:polysaccharide pyruvyl transferase family protein [Caldilineales bacterium]
MDLPGYIKQLPDLPLYFYPNPGNAGDSVISCATFQILDRQDRKYQTRAYSLNYRAPEQGIILCGGGGSFVGDDERVFNLMADYHAKVGKLVILPQTIVGRTDLLRSFGENVDIICRERTSYDYVVRLGVYANVLLMDDAAISLNVPWLLAHPARCRLLGIPWLLRFRRLDRYIAFRRLRRKRLRELRARHGSSTLNCFRVDGERTDIPLPADNLDLSVEIMLGVRPKALARLVTYELLAFLNNFETINTNRLHLGILSALLGKHVNFFANSYFKNESVYRFSLAQRFPNVHWCGDQHLSCS